MLVMRRVAVAMRTVYGVKEVSFTHDLCAGIVRYEKTGVFGAAGGLFFWGDFGAKNNQPNTVDFFIPRYALHDRSAPEMLVHNRYTVTPDSVTHSGYPDDVMVDECVTNGKLKIVVRKDD
jgi:hypothetical protein